jgi:hypothetical protein
MGLNHREVIVHPSAADRFYSLHYPPGFRNMDQWRRFCTLDEWQMRLGLTHSVLPDRDSIIVLAFTTDILRIP